MSRLKLLSPDPFGCPYLFLAPMEGVGDRSFRRAMASVGGFDEGCTEFLRVPANAHIPSLCKQYIPDEISPIPQAVQIMGSDPVLMGEMARALEEKGAPRIDLNCGCPSNTVTGKGAGSSLLKDPQLLKEIAQTMVRAVKIPVTAKLRSGFLDTSLFKENLLAAQESGIAFLTLHPRTKEEGYGPPARWDLIAEAKSLLHIPVVGNGDILTIAHALKVLKETRCDALMIGRGAIMNPSIFQEIRAHFSGQSLPRTEESLNRYFQTFIQDLPEVMSVKVRVSKLKQLMSFFLKGNEELMEMRLKVLRGNYESVDDFMALASPMISKKFLMLNT